MDHHAAIGQMDDAGACQGRPIQWKINLVGLSAVLVQRLIAVGLGTQIDLGHGYHGLRLDDLPWFIQVEAQLEGGVPLQHILQGGLQSRGIHLTRQGDAERLIERAPCRRIVNRGQPAFGLPGCQGRFKKCRVDLGCRAIARGNETQRDQLLQRLGEDLDDAVGVRIGHGLGDEVAELFIQVQAVEAGQVVEQADVGHAIVPLQAPQRGAVHGLDRGAALREGRVQAIDQALCAAIELAVELTTAALEVQQGGVGCRQCQGMAYEGAGEVGHTGFGVRIITVLPVATVQGIQPVGVAGDGGKGQAAADDLAVGGDVGAHAVELLRATRGHAEAGHHLVEDQGAANLVGDLAQGFHELARLHRRVLVLDRLGHDGRQLGAAFAQHAQRVFAVPVQHQDVLNRIGQDARGGGQRAQLLGAAHDYFIKNAVVRVGENGDGLAAGHRARDAHGAHHGLRTRVAKAHAFHAGELGDQVGDLGGQGVLRAHFQAQLQLLADRGDDALGLVTQQVAAKAREQVDVLVAVQIPQVGTLGAVDHDGVDQVLPQWVESSDHARVGHGLAVLLTEAFGLARALVVALDKVGHPLHLGGCEIGLGLQGDAGRGAKGLFQQRGLGGLAEFSSGGRLGGDRREWCRSRGGHHIGRGRALTRQQGQLLGHQLHLLLDELVHGIACHRGLVRREDRRGHRCWLRSHRADRWWDELVGGQLCIQELNQFGQGVQVFHQAAETQLDAEHALQLQCRLGQ